MALFDYQKEAIEKRLALLNSIRASHPNGIYTAQDFFDKMSARIQYYVSDMNQVAGPYKLVSMKMYDGEFESLKKSFCFRYTEFGSKQKKDGFINDLFTSGPVRGVFLTLEDAKAYRSNILQFYELLTERLFFGI